MEYLAETAALNVVRSVSPALIADEQVRGKERVQGA